MSESLDIWQLEQIAEKTYYNDPENLVFYYLKKIENDETIVIIQGDKMNGFTESRTPKDSYYEIYKEYYPSGIIKKSGKILGDATAIGIWYYFDEQGNFVEEIDEDKKFGAFGFLELLNFLMEKKLIEEKTYLGISKIRMVFSEKNMIWYIRITHPRYMIEEYEINGNTGEVKLHKSFQGGQM